MIRCQEVLEAMERIAPKALAEDWDNVGLLVGSPAQEIEKIFVCLDVSDALIDRAIAEKVNLIVAHHPMIFRPMKSIRTDLPLGRRIQRLLAHDIAVLAAHTNLDIAEGGVNDVLANAIGLMKLSSFVRTSEDEEDLGHSLGRMGRLPEPMTAEELAAWVKKALPARYVRVVKAGDRKVRKVAICGGSGAEFIDRAAFLGANAYITGDVRYHDAQHAAELGMHVIDAGHFATEYPVVRELRRLLEEELSACGGKVMILEDKEAVDFFQIVL